MIYYWGEAGKSRWASVEDLIAEGIVGPWYNHKSSRCEHEGPCPGDGNGWHVYPHNAKTGEVQ